MRRIASLRGTLDTAFVRAASGRASSGGEAAGIEEWVVMEVIRRNDRRFSGVTTPVAINSTRFYAAIQCRLKVNFSLQYKAFPRF